jgi:hypothetical protein
MQGNILREWFLKRGFIEIIGTSPHKIHNDANIRSCCMKFTGPKRGE